MGSQRDAPTVLPPAKTRYPLYRRLGGPQSRSGQVRKISPPTGIRSPDRPARSDSLYRLSYPGSSMCFQFEKIEDIIDKELNFRREIWCSWDRASWYISIVKQTRCIIFRVYWVSLYMFRTAFLSTIRSPRLYIQRHVYVIQVSWLLASGTEMEFGPASKQSTNMYDIYLTLYVQSRTPDDGRKDRPKHVEWSLFFHRTCCYRTLFKNPTHALCFNP